MNRLKYFDQYQFIISLTGMISAFLSIVAFFVTVFTATLFFDESGAITDIAYNEIAQTIYGVFVLINITATVWFIARSITYKMRVVEDDRL